MWPKNFHLCPYFYGPDHAHVHSPQKSLRIEAPAFYSLTELQIEVSTALMKGLSLPHDKIRISERQMSALRVGCTLQWA